MRGLIACVQMGALELHIWGSHNDTLEKPDRIVFDLDPDEDMDFAVVREAAKDMRDRLAALGLETFPMVTGGKGIHVVAPLKPRYGWDDVKAFCEAVARTMAGGGAEALPRGRHQGASGPAASSSTISATVAAPPRSARSRPAPGAARRCRGRYPGRQLARLDSARLATVENAAELLRKKRSDPWDGYFDVDQVLPIEKLGGK